MHIFVFGDILKKGKKFEGATSRLKLVRVE
jgi:hypothetical protein